MSEAQLGTDLLYVPLCRLSDEIGIGVHHRSGNSFRSVSDYPW
jgi:hypothetical protein